MIKYAELVLTYHRGGAIDIIADAMKAFKESKDFDSTKEYTIIFNDLEDTFDVYLLK